MLISQSPVSALGHQYHPDTDRDAAATCKKSGYTAVVCINCGDQREASRTTPLGHLYGGWKANGDGTHSAVCIRSGCKHTGNENCRVFPVWVGDMSISLCPVCGEDEAHNHLLQVENGVAEFVTESLPRGIPVIRHGMLKDGTQIITVAFVFAGEPVQPKGIVKIALPAIAIKGCTMMLLHADGTEREIPCTVLEGQITFELDFSTSTSLEAAPAVLLRLVPASDP